MARHDDSPNAIGENLDRTRLAMPLLRRLEEMEKELGREEAWRSPVQVIVDLNLVYPGRRGIHSARNKTYRLIEQVVADVDAQVAGCGADEAKSRYAFQHVFARLTGNQLRALLLASGPAIPGDGGGPIYKIWLDDVVRPFMNRSMATIKADAAQAAYSAAGEGICWAVIDSGVDGAHPHFQLHRNLELDAPLHHADFSVDPVHILPLSEVPGDDNGHGTHVAGIIAGQLTRTCTVVQRQRDESGDIDYRVTKVEGMCSVAPRCKVLSLRVLDENGHGNVSSLIAALGYVNELNAQGRWRVVHGVNLSVGYEFDAEWFACGQSPLCIEVNRLVRSGVVVVVAAGNTGYGFAQTQSQGAVKTGLDLSINDPGNAEHAITVGSTHREEPHTYGVSYFSSKGPTGDGRLKPDLVAPGERIVSCAAGVRGQEMEQAAGLQPLECEYREESGTSMAAPHVSGAIAGFLSIRSEFIGEPERIKSIFLDSCTDLRRERYFQGYGLLDLMRAIQSI